MALKKNISSLSSIYHNPLIGCDGRAHSDKLLKYLLNKSIEDEKFELSAIYRDEIIRRKTSMDEIFEQLKD